MAIKRVENMRGKENALYVVQDEKIYEIESPSSGFGTTKLIWRHGKVVRVETTTSEIFPDD